MQRIASDKPSPGQDMAREVVERATELYRQDNTLTIRLVPGHRRVVGNEIADTCERSSQEDTADAGSKKAMERISLSFLKRRAAERATKRWRDTLPSSTKGNEFSPCAATIRNRESDWRAGTLRAAANHFYQLLSGHALTAPFLKVK